jgi:acetoin utilization protein AcuC
MPDGTPTKFGTRTRNLEAEKAALGAGLVPGQVRSGLHLLREAMTAFEVFVSSLGHDVYFVDPLYYHNAMIFERYGFAYQSGKRFMERIQAGFSLGGDLLPKLDGSAFRKPEAAGSLRLRSWAIHDGILDEPFDRVTMYKTIGKHAGISTAPSIPW